MSGARLLVTTASAMSEVDPDAWDALAGGHNPFVEHAFLAWLEEAGCVGSEAGWVPAHLLAWLEDGGSKTLVGADPAYVKNNSYGEYIFDWGWADASMRAGLPYYPKVTLAVPFTPATGPRLLVSPDAARGEVVTALADGARALAEAVEASGVHWLFVEPHEAEALAQRGYAHRHSFQFHWSNDGYESFDDFLASLRSKRRKEIRRERRDAASAGLALAVERVADLSRDDRMRVYACYRSTIDDHMQIPYLTQRWFLGLGEHLADTAYVATARQEGEVVAAALAFHKGDHLYGRYWGALVDVRGLHFELCYYRLLEWAIEHGVTRVEAGAQGAHKVARGFLPTVTHSAHWLRHPGLDDAVRRYVVQEQRHVAQSLEAYGEQSPFKRDG